MFHAPHVESGLSAASDQIFVVRSQPDADDDHFVFSYHDSDINEPLAVHSDNVEDDTASCFYAVICPACSKGAQHHVSCVNAFGQSMDTCGRLSCVCTRTAQLFVHRPGSTPLPADVSVSGNGSGFLRDPCHAESTRLRDQRVNRPSDVCFASCGDASSVHMYSDVINISGRVYGPQGAGGPCCHSKDPPAPNPPVDLTQTTGGGAPQDWGRNPPCSLQRNRQHGK